MLKWITKPIGCLVSIISTLFCLALIASSIFLSFFQWGFGDFVTEGIEKASEFPTSVANTGNNLFKGRVDFMDLKVKNPSPDFKTEDFLHFKRVLADFNLEESIDGVSVDKMVFEDVVIDLESFTWIQNSKGDINIRLFIKRLRAAAAEAKKEEGETKKTPFIIENLNVRVNKVVRYRNGYPKEYIVDYKKNFKDISDKNIEKVIAEVSVALAKRQASFLIDEVRDYLAERLSSSDVTESVKKIKATIEDASENTKNTIDKIF